MRPCDEPAIHTVARTNTGHPARSLCLVDAQPADIIVTVEADGGFRATVRAFDHMGLTWNLLLRADHLDYQRLPADPGSPATRDADLRAGTRRARRRLSRVFAARLGLPADARRGRHHQFPVDHDHTPDTGRRWTPTP
ncbi:hypothetical protein IU469_31920 [Nocardia puris]|uniref:hypothetical protein n=1 Tax=Nocardia puris TaxID=208602 RepID=UPI001893610E|nr:hypothetical protein [Nocardia puris]MBF6370280.1 hypothetical protein [Nocardia puris]